jgi:hypothetical protein
VGGDEEDDIVAFVKIISLIYPCFIVASSTIPGEIMSIIAEQNLTIVTIEAGRCDHTNGFAMYCHHI